MAARKQELLQCNEYFTRALRDAKNRALQRSMFAWTQSECEHRRWQDCRRRQVLENVIDDPAVPIRSIAMCEDKSEISDWSDIMKIHPRCFSSHLHALAFAGITLMTMTTAAQAEPHVCPGGAGNGEVFLGMDPGGPGVAPAPLCDWASQGPAATPKPRRDPEYWGDPNRKTDLPKGWTASVEGIDKPVLGVAKGKASRAEAIKAAMEDCRRQGATRCELLAATSSDE